MAIEVVTVVAQRSVASPRRRRSLCCRHIYRALECISRWRQDTGTCHQPHPHNTTPGPSDVMASSEEHTSAEAEGCRLLLQEVADGVSCFAPTTSKGKLSISVLEQGSHQPRRSRPCNLCSHRNSVRHTDALSVAVACQKNPVRTACGMRRCHQCSARQHK